MTCVFAVSAARADWLSVARARIATTIRCATAICHMERGDLRPGFSVPLRHRHAQKMPTGTTPYARMSRWHGARKSAYSPLLRRKQQPLRAAAAARVDRSCKHSLLPPTPPLPSTPPCAGPHRRVAGARRRSLRSDPGRESEEPVAHRHVDGRSAARHRRAGRFGDARSAGRSSQHQRQQGRRRRRKRSRSTSIAS